MSDFKNAVLSIAKEKGIKGVTQIADNMGKDQSSVWSILNGNPTLKNMKKVFTDGLGEELVITTENGHKYKI